MRIGFALLALALAAWPAEALAYENFIPLGHSYSPDEPVLPALNSDRDKVNAQVDIYESEIYRRELAAKVFQSNLDNFVNKRQFKGGGTFLDY